MRFDVLTLHPELCQGPLSVSILKRAIDAGAFEVGITNIRDFGIGRHRMVDDTPYGGGAGMVMRVDVVDSAIDAVRSPTSRVVLMDPGGTPFNQSHARRLAKEEHLVLVCGHYEGIDGRVAEHLVDEVISIGDFVLTGGELAAMTVLDAVARLLPGVLGNPESAEHESFSQGLLEAPHYTRPSEYQGWGVPDVLKSGHHGRIAQWRHEQAVARTQQVRPDLLPREKDGHDM